MPKKRGTKKKKKFQEDEFAEMMDPSTMLGPGGGAAGTADVQASPSKTGKKKKKTKEEKALLALEKQCEKMVDDPDLMNAFLDRMINWFANNSTTIVKLFQLVDRTGDGVVNHNTFKAGLFDLNCPSTKTEIHLLTKIVDPKQTDEIKYNEINDYLSKAWNDRHKTASKKASGKKLILSERSCTPCPQCLIGRCEPGYKEKFPQYVNLEMRMITFDKYPRYPGHFTKLVTTSLPVCGLIEIIVQETRTSSTKISVFWDKTRTTRSRLNPDLTLDECGIHGASRHLPQQVTLYYDYVTEFEDCALLLCDHYFGKNITVFT